MPPFRCPWKPWNASTSEPRSILDAFWLAYLRLGFSVLATEALGCLVYFAFGNSVPNRGPLEALACVGLFGSLLAVPFTETISTRPWRGTFSLAAGLASGVLLTACCALDGGTDSPVIYLFALPVLNASLALSWRGVWLIASASLTEVGFLAYTDPHINSADWKLVAVACLLGGAISLSLVATWNRIRLQQAEQQDREQLAHLAAHDPLTGCLNPRSFQARLDAEVARFERYETPLCLAIVDIDYFKIFNDAHGHLAGDTVLAEVAATLGRACRSSDVLARIGGDEFAIVMPSTGLDAAARGAKRLRDEVEQAGLGVTVSIGVASIDPVEPTSRQLVKSADALLYDAKLGGRNRVISTGSSRPGGGREPSPVESVDLRLVTERLHNARSRIAASETLLEATMGAAPVGICFLDSEFSNRKGESSVYRCIWPLAGTEHRKVLARRRSRALAQARTTV